MKKIKTAVLGCGWIGIGASSDILRDDPATHVAGIQANSSFTLVGLQDISTESLDNAMRFAPGIPFFDSPIDLFDSIKPDAVVIASPPENHIELIRTSIQYNIKNILCEKPLCLDLDEAHEIIKIAKKNKVNLVINHMRRFSPLIIKLRSYLRNVYIRDTLTGQICSGYGFYDKGLYHCATHIIDLLVFLLGDVKSVSAVHSNVYKACEHDISPEAILTFSDCQISLKPFHSSQYTLAEISLFGVKGAVRLRHMWGRRIELIGSKSCLDYSAYSELNETESKILLEEEPYMVSTYRHFESTIKNPSLVESSLTHSLHIMRVLDSIRESADQSGAITYIIEDKI